MFGRSSVAAKPKILGHFRNGNFPTRGRSSATIVTRLFDTVLTPARVEDWRLELSQLPLTGSSYVHQGLINATHPPNPSYFSRPALRSRDSMPSMWMLLTA